MEPNKRENLAKITSWRRLEVYREEDTSDDMKLCTTGVNMNALYESWSLHIAPTRIHLEHSPYSSAAGLGSWYCQSRIKNNDHDIQSGFSIDTEEAANQKYSEMTQEHFRVSQRIPRCGSQTDG